MSALHAIASAVLTGTALAVFAAMEVVPHWLAVAL